MSDGIQQERELREAWQEAHEILDNLRHSNEAEALRLSAGDIDRRLTEMNQFREQLQTERVDYVLRREHDLLADRIKSLEIARGEQSGKAAAYASVAGIVGIVAGIIMHYWK